MGDEEKGAVTYLSLPALSVSRWRQLEMFVMFTGGVALCRPPDRLIEVEADGGDNFLAKLDPGGVRISRARLNQMLVSQSISSRRSRTIPDILYSGRRGREAVTGGRMTDQMGGRREWERL